MRTQTTGVRNPPPSRRIRSLNNWTIGPPYSRRYSAG